MSKLMSTPDQFVTAASRIITPSLSDRRGGLLYSGAHTLSRGSYYLLGFNPGGDADDPNSPTLQQSLGILAGGSEFNAYLDQIWTNPKPGCSPFQRRVQHLASLLNVDLRDLCASNLIFMKSKRAYGVAYPDDALSCWPIHQEILNIVQPKVIISIGNGVRSAYGFIQSGLAQGVVSASETEASPSGYGRWRFKTFRGVFNAKPLTVIGLPHFSYYPLDHDKYSAIAKKWLDLTVS